MRLESIFGLIALVVYFIVDVLLIPINLVILILALILIPIFWLIEKIFRGVYTAGYGMNIKQLFFAHTKYVWEEELKR